MRANFKNTRSVEQFATGIVKYNLIAIKILGNNILFLFLQTILIFYAHLKHQMVVY